MPVVACCIFSFTNRIFLLFDANSEVEINIMPRFRLKSKGISG
ncbi:hypothetical protein bthur0008_63070 [Bacillus thuringiensis serovar berliner ATCC 10792]|nr:hypothetical protein bthur0005_23470 [Bacillus thuringiensis serovar pakistani str. T13001]EEM62117.1 hypothetical protein bthur0008_63070 [Bacillus thuringiensis serovar berliner ATCC 10792]KZD70702.1 hypothetical protein B4118_0470 [Bacillus cereus]